VGADVRACFDIFYGVFQNRGVASHSNRPPPDDPLDTDPPDPEDARPEVSEPRVDPDARRTLERLLSELIRKGFEAGRVPLEKVSESFFSRDLASHLVGGLGDIRSAIVRAVAQEVGRFLREADIASELRRVLNGVDIEASVRVGFKVNDQGVLKPDVNVGVELGASAKEAAQRRRR
jgi:hypothetical protein